MKTSYATWKQLRMPMYIKVQLDAKAKGGKKGKVDGGKKGKDKAEEGKGDGA